VVGGEGEGGRGIKNNKDGRNCCGGGEGGRIVGMGMGGGGRGGGREY